MSKLGNTIFSILFDTNDIKNLKKEQTSSDHFENITWTDLNRGPILGKVIFYNAWAIYGLKNTIDMDILIPTWNNNEKYIIEIRKTCTAWNLPSANIVDFVLNGEIFALHHVLIKNIFWCKQSSIFILG